jgi:hypothetical protein
MLLPVIETKEEEDESSSEVFQIVEEMLCFLVVNLLSQMDSRQC